MGLSETAPVLTFNMPGNEHLGTVGLPLLETDIQLLDENDKPVEDGKDGQIAAKGSAGYVRVIGIARMKPQK